MTRKQILLVLGALVAPFAGILFGWATVKLVTVLTPIPEQFQSESFVASIFVSSICGIACLIGGVSLAGFYWKDGEP